MFDSFFNASNCNSALLSRRIKCSIVEVPSPITVKNSFFTMPVILPSVQTYNDPVWHLYCIRINNRDEFREKLSSLGIQTLIHYPIPPHLQDAYRFLNLGKKSFPLAESFASELVSLPIGPSLTQTQVAHVVEGVKSLFC